jgi:hypothetical protein
MDHRICEIFTLEENVETSVTQSCLSVACRDLKTNNTQNKLLCIEFLVKYKHI